LAYKSYRDRRAFSEFTREMTVLKVLTLRSMTSIVDIASTMLAPQPLRESRKPPETGYEAMRLATRVRREYDAP